MVNEQPILNRLSNAAIFLILGIQPGEEQTVRDGIENLSGLVKTVGFRVPEDGLHAVVGVGSRAWDRLFSGPKPSKLHPFPELKGKHYAPSTPGDLLIHIRSGRQGSAIELARLFLDQLGNSVHVIDHIDGFHYFDQRDLLGFVDGTENPEGDEAMETIFVGDLPDDHHDYAFIGGAYVYIQKYVHDMAAWNALPVSEQEKVVGRTKLENVELPDDVKPDNSHVALNSVTDEDGNGVDIYRANMPWADLKNNQFGTFFIGYAHRPETVEDMLRNMFIGRPEGNTDRILDFSTALTGTSFFVPPYSFIYDLPPLP